MTKKDHTIRHRLLRVLNEVVTRIGVDSRMSITFEDIVGGSTDVVATVKDVYPYNVLDMTVSRNAMAKINDNELAFVLTHELAHVYVFGPLRNLIAKSGYLNDHIHDLEEAACEIVAFWVHNAAKK